MVRRAPRIGLASLFLSVSGSALIILNFFGMIDQYMNPSGGNQQIQLYPIFSSILFDKSVANAYVGPEVIGIQELILSILSISLLLIGIFGIRRRPYIPPPEVLDETEQRMRLEAVPIEVGTQNTDTSSSSRTVVDGVLGIGETSSSLPPVPKGLTEPRPSFSSNQDKSHVPDTESVIPDSIVVVENQLPQEEISVEISENEPPPSDNPLFISQSHDTNDVIEFNSSFSKKLRNNEPRSFWNLFKIK